MELSSNERHGRVAVVVQREMKGVQCPAGHDFRPRRLEANLWQAGRAARVEEGRSRGGGVGRWW